MIEEESFNSLILACTNCGLKFHAPDLKLSPITNEMVCRNCYNFPGSKLNILKDKTPETKKNLYTNQHQAQDITTKDGYLTLPSSVVQRKDSSDLQEKNMVKNAPGQTTYLCEDCRYTFARNTGKFNGSCPYCSRRRIKVLKRR
jgi:DNA-directed RNA polymerase subunit RPC12/RpoP